MKIMDCNDGDVMELASECLRDDGVIVHHTDTCYGFACDVLSRVAFDKLYAIKKMVLDKPLSVLVDSIDMASEYGVFSAKALEIVRRYWPGALTVIVPRGKNLPDFFNIGVDTIGVRCPAHRFSFELINRLGRPIVSTSANLAGGVEAYSIGDFVRQFSWQSLQPDLVIDAGVRQKNKPSTIVEIINGDVKLIRQGDLKL